MGLWLTPEIGHNAIESIEEEGQPCHRPLRNIRGLAAILGSQSGLSLIHSFYASLFLSRIEPIEFLRHQDFANRLI